ncbi:vesicle-associated protein 1-2-like [Quillaja saponaria]|uniref:Vesicle-associated protein 1-2-like n=1 Tax=Quillaja saponaria TaxID=32244 RepID=A0AAD7QAP6_QUISA|nr:vesicle-associated protein 1-2-like [Quillaja saponaria]KAJ7978046.1 vesicle-associated protein 1-2-like [Quillaja saponaria]
MSKQLLEIQPKELKFIFELKKRCSCSVQLTNNTCHYVAFKVKTTSPRKYSVQPNVGILMPESTTDFIVTMQAQQVAPVDMVCKDKFLIQSTIVPAGTSCEDITSSMFVKEESEYVEQHKLRVTLITPPNSPELFPIDGASKNELTHEGSIERDQMLGRVETLSPQTTVTKKVEEHKMVNEELKQEKYKELKTDQDVGLKPMKDEEGLQTDKIADLKAGNNIEELKLIKKFEEMKSKLDELKSKLNEAEVTVSKLTEERRLSNQEMKILRETLADLSKRGGRSIHIGFPLLYVCTMAIICIVIGYSLHS